MSPTRRGICKNEENNEERKKTVWEGEFGSSLNAARIAMELPDEAREIDDFRMATAVACSAMTLGEIEFKRGPNPWEGARLDWETACARIAQRIVDTKKPATRQWMLKMMRGET